MRSLVWAAVSVAALAAWGCGSGTSQESRQFNLKKDEIKKAVDEAKKLLAVKQPPESDRRTAAGMLQRASAEIANLRAGLLPSDSDAQSLNDIETEIKALLPKTAVIETAAVRAASWGEKASGPKNEVAMAVAKGWTPDPKDFDKIGIKAPPMPFDGAGKEEKPPPATDLLQVKPDDIPKVEPGKTPPPQKPAPGPNPLPGGETPAPGKRSEKWSSLEELQKQTRPLEVYEVQSQGTGAAAWCQVLYPGDGSDFIASITAEFLDEGGRKLTTGRTAYIHTAETPFAPNWKTIDESAGKLLNADGKLMHLGREEPVHFVVVAVDDARNINKVRKAMVYVVCRNGREVSSAGPKPREKEPAKK